MLIFKQVKESLLLGIKTYTEFKLEFNLNLVISMLISFLISYLLYLYTNSKQYIFYFLIISLTPTIKFNLDRLIKTGNLDKFLVFPANLFTIYFFMKLGKVLFGILIKLAVIYLLSLIFNVQLNWLGILLYLPFATLFNALFNFVVELFAFFVYEYIWLERIISNIESFFRGKLLPLDFLPHYLQNFSLYSFFAIPNYYLYLISVGKFKLEFLVNYIIWLILFIILANILWKKGLKNYETQFN